MPWRRFIIAVLWGAAISAAYIPLTIDWVGRWTEAIVAGALPESTPDSLAAALLSVATAIGLSLPGVAVAALVAIFGPRDTETRCRKCGYILRGISEPRCPECGERI